MFRKLAALAAAGLVSGCATIIQGTTENVSVTTTPDQGAQCTLKNSEGVWYVTTPGSTSVHKTKNDLTVDCTKAGYAPGHSVAISHFGGTTAANVIAGGVVGIGVDAASGANYYYDSPIVVALGPAQPGTPAPVASAGMVATNPGDQPPHLDKSYPNPQPPYPDAAQVNGEQGNVVLRVKVGANGKVRNIEIAQSSGFADLDNAAIEGVLGWHFLPAVADGETETAWTKITIAYRLPTSLPAPAPAPSGHGR